MGRPKKGQRSVKGNCKPRKVTRTAANGKTYTYYEAKLTTGYSYDGKQQQKSLTGKTSKECQEKIDELRKSIKEGTFKTDSLAAMPPSKITVARWMKHWLNNYCKHVKPSTLAKYRSCVKHHIIPSIGSVPLSDLTTEKIQFFYNRLKNTKTGEELSSSSINDIHIALHRALKCAVIAKKIPSNPANKDLLSLPTVEVSEFVPIEEEKLKILMKKLEKSPHRNVLWCLLFLGLRRGECLGLTWDAIDFKNKTISINKQLQCNQITNIYELITPKKNKTRVIEMPDFVADILKDEKKQQDSHKKEFEEQGGIWRNEWNLVFTRSDGRYLPPNTVFTNFKRRAKEADLPNVKLHDLRHQYASEMLSRGTDLSTIQKNLGHTKASFTMEKYIRSLRSARRECANSSNAWANDIVTDQLKII